MRKAVLFFLITGLVFAESPPSFREYVLGKAQNRRYSGGVDYVLVSVDERRSVLFFRGYYNLLYRDGYCLRYRFPAFTKVRAGGAWRQKSLIQKT